MMYPGEEGPQAAIETKLAESPAPETRRGFFITIIAHGRIFTRKS